MIPIKVTNIADLAELVRELLRNGVKAEVVQTSEGFTVLCTGF